ncbi:hypothetical protein [Cellulosimicrobium funkei]|uniref:hypothetical protein n=1 Tax=Cellulosimicrobium funkei TaxID=264251 RepID=UPI0034167B7D
MVLSTVAVGGCSGGGGAQAGAIEGSTASAATQQPSQDEVPEAEILDDAAICAAYGDVLTIVENADLALAEGRMEPQEHDGWYQLATRVLDRLSSTGDSDVQRSIGQLKEVAPAVASGAFTDSTGVRSPEWDEAEGALGTACDDLGAPLVINTFTGG